MSLMSMAAGVLGQQGGWTPADLPNLWDWWNASDQTSFTNTGSPNYYVDDWDGQVNARRLSGAGSLPQQRDPTDLAPDKFYWNADELQYGTAADAKFFTDGSAYTILIPFSMDSLIDHRTLVGTFAATPTTSPSFDILSFADGRIRHNVTVQTGSAAVENQTPASTIAAATWYILAIRSEPSRASGPNRSELFIDGGTPFKNNTKTNTPSASNPRDAFTFGARGVGNKEHLGNTHDLIVCDDWLSNANLNLAGNYLATKYSTLSWTDV